MVRIEGGTFRMGSMEDKDEQPIHPVTLHSFEIGKYPVNQRQWKAVMGDNPSGFRGDDLPVEKVSWEDCQLYCEQLSKKTGLSFRLPTEAEWEYAAGGGNRDRTKWAGTDQENQLEAYAWYEKNSNNQTHPVGQKKPNALGLYDMSGNVWEWCQDRWRESYQDAPADGSAWEAGKSAYRVRRGGRWSSTAANLRVANRNSGDPDRRGYFLGFRPARTL